MFQVAQMGVYGKRKFLNCSWLVGLRYTYYMLGTEDLSIIKCVRLEKVGHFFKVSTALFLVPQDL